MNINLTKGGCQIAISIDCDDDNVSTVHPDNLKKIDPSNPSNPMDEIGLFHNYAMRRIFLSTGEKEFKKEEVVKQIAALVKKYPFKSKVLSNINKANINETMEKISDPLFSALKYNWLFPPTPEQMEMFPDFLDGVILWGAKLIQSFDKTTDSLIAQKEELIAYEQTIMDSKIRKNVKDGALVALSIVRHSSVLYIEHFNNGGDPTGTGIAAKGKCNCKAVARVAVADVVGAAAGFLSGGGVGAVVGAIVGSGKQIIKEID